MMQKMAVGMRSRREEFIREVAGNNGVIVPVGEFISEITRKTGWSIDELKTKDMGEIEKKLNVRAHKPSNLRSTKRGKSMSDLYVFVDQNRKQKARNSIESLLRS